METTFPAENLEKLKFGEPGKYSIRIKGHLDMSLCECLGGMTIAKTCQESGQWQTTLVGEVLDQAALTGVLNTLYNRHFPIIEVRFLAEEDE